MNFKLNSKIKINNLTKYFGYKLLFSKINIKLKAGQIVLLSGENGSGKSSLLKLLSGLDEYYKGEISIDNNQVKPSTLRKQSLILPHIIPLYPELTIKENSRYFFACRNKKWQNKIWEEQEDLWKLDKYRLQQCSTLSAGNKQKIGLIWLKLGDAPICLLDEPTNELDNYALEIFNKMIIDLKNQNKIVIIASHHKERINKIDSFYKINNYNILNSGKP